jgi:sugar/nucleoside kinase (ribokinase family)
MFDIISIGSITEDIFVLTSRGKLFKTPKDKLAPEWIGFEFGEKICADDIIENPGGVATNLSLGTKKLGLKSFSMGPKKAAISVIIIDKKTRERVIFYNKPSGIIDLARLKKMKTKWISVSSFTGNWRREAGIILSYTEKNKAKLALAPSTSMIRDGYINFKKLMKSAEIVFLNKNEAIEIASNESARVSDTKKLIALLHELGPKVVCLTDGSKGAYCSDREKVYYSPIKKVKTVDTTGAGDAFASGFLGLYLKGATIEKCLEMGILNSANVVRYIGTTRGLLTK